MKFILKYNVTCSWALPCQKLSHFLGLPPLERDVLYGRPPNRFSRTLRKSLSSQSFLLIKFRLQQEEYRFLQRRILRFFLGSFDRRLSTDCNQNKSCVSSNCIIFITKYMYFTRTASVENFLGCCWLGERPKPRWSFYVKIARQTDGMRYWQNAMLMCIECIREEWCDLEDWL